VNKFMHLRIQEKTGNFFSSGRTVSFSSALLAMESVHNFKNTVKFFADFSVTCGVRRAGTVRN
jgi:hypothetical protein